MTTTRPTLALVASLAIAATPALAHTGENQAFTALTGFLHPLGGADHLAAMIAVGVWSALAGGERRWLWPLAFVVAMIGGALLARAGIELPAVEAGIAASVVVVGLLIALAWRPAAWLGALVVAGFAVVHGHAHGAEAPEGSFAAYVGGFAAGTLLLHLAGLAIGSVIQARSGLNGLRIAGGLVAVAGAVLAFG